MMSRLDCRLATLLPPGPPTMKRTASRGESAEWLRKTTTGSRIARAFGFERFSETVSMPHSVLSSLTNCSGHAIFSKRGRTTVGIAVADCAEAAEEHRIRQTHRNARSIL